jgi:uncharacterized membrane protein
MQMATTAWKFSGTEKADEAVLRLKDLDAKEYIDVQDIAVIRWPQYAAAPTAQEHVTDEGSKVSAMVSKMKHAAIDSSMIESAKDDMTPGTSVLVLLSTDAAINTVAAALHGLGMELTRSDLSVQQQDRVRAAFIESAAAPPDLPGPPA